MKKMLIAYYSWSNGNTKRIADEMEAVKKVQEIRRLLEDVAKEFEK